MDREEKFILCGGGRAVVMDSSYNVLAVAPLCDDNSYKFRLTDFTQEERLLLSAVTEEGSSQERVLLGSSLPTDNLALWHRRLGHRNQRDLGHAISKRAAARTNA